MPGLDSVRLLTPGSVHGCLADFASGRSDAAGELARRLDSAHLKASVLRWLPLAERTASRPLLGHDRAVRGARPYAGRRSTGSSAAPWPPPSPGGGHPSARASDCCARPTLRRQFSACSSTATWATSRTDFRGALRRHLACGLLTVAGVGERRHRVRPLHGHRHDPGHGGGQVRRGLLGSASRSTAKPTAPPARGSQDAERPWSTLPFEDFGLCVAVRLEAGSSPTCPSASGSPRYGPPPC